MNSVKKLLKHTFIWRYCISLYFAIKKVRIHPTVKVFARLNQISFAHGSKFNHNVRIQLGENANFNVAESCWVEYGVEIQSDTLIEIGQGTTIQRNCSLNGSIKIGELCIFAPNVFLSSGSHIFKAWPEMAIRHQEKKYHSMSRELRPSGFEDKPVKIGDDCWLGVNVVIMPGVEVGKGSIIGANSVVTKSIPPYSIVVGIPGKVVKSRLD